MAGMEEIERSAGTSRDQPGGPHEVVGSAIAKASWRILPLLGLGYLFAFLDRVNIGFAALEMNVDLGFSATIYGFGAGLFFLSYALFEIPSSALMLRFGARRWLGRIMISWGLCAAATMLVQVPWQFYAARFLLGVAEAGFFPAVIYYLGYWFPKSVRGRTISYFFLFGPLASVVLGSVSGAMLSLNGFAGLRGWQWLLMLQGLPAVLIGLAIWRLLPDSPERAGWLSPEERVGLRAVLDEEAAAIGPPLGDGLVATIRDPAVLKLGLLGALLVGSGTTTAVNLPLLLQATTSLSRYQIGYVVSAGGGLAILAMLTTGAISDRRGERFVPGIVCALCWASGAALVAVQASSAVTIAGSLLFSMFGWSQVLMWASLWPDLLHPRRLALGGAAINTASQIGAFAGPIAWGLAGDATGTFSVGLAGLALAVLAGAGVFALLMHSGKARRRNRAPITARSDVPPSLREIVERGA